MEESLDRGGAEAVIPALTLEAEPQRLLQRQPDSKERGDLRRRLDPAKASTDLTGECARVLHLTPEVIGVFRQAKNLELGGLARAALANKNHVAQVRDQNEPVPAPVAADLLGPSSQPGIVLHCLGLDDTALRSLPFPRAALLDLPGRAQGKLGLTRALACPFQNAEDLGFEYGRLRREGL